MPQLNWDAFRSLPGAVNENFESLCRALIRRHYGRFGRFAALANQPGVEFHLRLHFECALGSANKWFGWQCKWWDSVSSGQAITKTRRNQLQDAISKSERDLPGLTDWILWTRHTLTKNDQDWFYGLQSPMRLHLQTIAEVEELLSGPAEIYRSTWFGELVLTPETLDTRHTAAAAQIGHRWMPDVHQVVNAERDLRRQLLDADAWIVIDQVSEQLRAEATEFEAEASSLPPSFQQSAEGLLTASRTAAGLLNDVASALTSGDFDILEQRLIDRTAPSPEWSAFIRRLRSRRFLASLSGTNLIADMHRCFRVLEALDAALHCRLISVSAEAGCGKTQLAAQLTAPAADRPAGVLLYGTRLDAAATLDRLAQGFVVNGKPVATFEALVAAVDAAGQRAACCLPIVIDGLNEAEDPRKWKPQLASLATVLKSYPHVLLVCTLRPAFLEEAVPADIALIEISGFEEDADAALKKYFDYYKIERGDAELPLQFLKNPLALKLFCEVTNPERKTVVGVEAMPDSQADLFEKYLDQIANRIQEISSKSHRYYPADVRTTLDKIGFSLWEIGARRLDMKQLRHQLDDHERPWDQSIVRALEQDGVLLRDPGRQPGVEDVRIVYDLLAGHLIADAILSRQNSREFPIWLNQPEVKTALMGAVGERHTLADDVMRALVVMYPRRMHHLQFWPLLDEPWRTNAIHIAARLEPRYLDSATVGAIRELALNDATRREDIFYRLRVVRGSTGHPLNANFLDETLRSMSLADRDLRWTEWIRQEQRSLLQDVLALENRWQDGNAISAADRLRARWVMWLLTTTVRPLRDHATRALYWYGRLDPAGLGDLVLDSLSVNDPYVPERTLAACYGAAMALWADPSEAAMREMLPNLAKSLTNGMFLPDAANPTRHTLMRDYALGIISLALRVSPNCISSRETEFLLPPYDQLPTPFPPAEELEDTVISTGESAIGGDFGNYTIGRLIANRGAYDFEHPTYRAVRKQIEYRISELGYSSARFYDIDQEIRARAWRAEVRREWPADRYGKKYAWIAYFEMHGLRSDKEAVPDYRARERTSDAGIDPSFPEPPRTWSPPLPDLFQNPLLDYGEWLTDGPTPGYDHLLHPNEVDGLLGPWTLLEGYIEQSAPSDDRRVFSFLRGLFVKRQDVPKLISEFYSLDYPGNKAIPEPLEDYYTFAGEIPWSPRFASSLRNRNGKTKRDLRFIFDGYRGSQRSPGIRVEIPAYDFHWESHHSDLNQVSGVTVPAPALCERMGLSGRRSQWDFYDPSGNPASIFRKCKMLNDTYGSRLLYLKSVLLKSYLAQTRQTMVWLVWGERGYDYRISNARCNDLSSIFRQHKHIHRHAATYESTS